MPEVITDNLELWTSALLTRSTAGRGSNGKLEAYGIKKLRELILELAVRGKLVPQDHSDEPASVLLEKIAKEKSRLIQEGLIKKEKSLPEISDDEKSFLLPSGWEWGRLQDVSSYVQRGKGPRYADFGKVRVVSQKCIQWAGFDLTQARYVDDASLDGYQPERFLRKDDLLWNSTGTGTAGRINVMPEVDPNSLVADSHVTIVRPLVVSSSFLSCYVSAPGIQQRIEPEHENSLVSGTTNQVELNLSAVVRLVVPVPPLAEQHRIVAKVDELMALCDQLEQQQTDSLAAHQTLVETLLGTLTRVESQQEFSAAWARIASHFDTLFTTEASIDQLKQTILQLAVMGKLVSQDPNDEPASLLLGKIAKEKARLFSAGEIRTQKSLFEIGEGEKPHPLPRSWEWTRFGDISYQITDGTHHTPTYVNEGIPFLSVKDMSAGRLDFSDTRFISREQHEELIKRCYPQRGDLLLTKVGTTGIPILVDTDEEFSIFVSVALIKFPLDKIHRRYLSLLVSSPLVKRQSEEGTEGIGNKNLVLRKIAAFVLAIPPLAEQRRIVAKVDELMALCDALKARLADAKTTQLHLADAIVEQSLG